MESNDIFYPEFDYPASHLSAFSLCIDVFIISLKSGEIVRFKPHEIAHFKEWLSRFNVRDIAVNDGISHSHNKPDFSKPHNGIFNLVKLNKRK